MAKCDICDKETGKVAIQRIGLDYNPHGKDIEVPYTMPVYCAECEKDIRAMEDDILHIQREREAWRAYGNETHHRDTCKIGHRGNEGLGKRD